MTDLQLLLDDADRDGIQKLVVGAVAYHDGRVLILRHSSDDDFLPGIEGWIALDGLSDSGLTGETAQVIRDWAATRR